jgi:chain length determinant protein (polysaccharide antigen chain regulator)
MPATTESTHHIDEIDLRDLLTVLWHSKWVIVGAAVITIAAAAVYTATVPYTYQASAQTSAPSPRDLAGYNLLNKVLAVAPPGVAGGAPGAITPSAIAPPLTSASAYAIYMAHLQSARLRQDFFEKVYLPDHPQTQTDAAKAALWNQLNQNLKIAVSPQAPGLTTLTLQGLRSGKLAKWLNQYIQMARQAAREQLGMDLGAAIQARIVDTNDRIDELRAVAAAQRKNDIVRLGDALKLARATGITTPLSAGNLVASYVGPTLFLRGSNALQAEIDLLKARTSDDPYIPQLPGLLSIRDQLQETAPGAIPVSLATVDLPATTPLSPIRPRKRMIMALGLLIGLMLGVVAALVRNRTRIARTRGDRR